ncbi:hypothetical protein LVJ83_06570 [Uruburuella testudinis]|uniref:Uncharacterized protein n=1 Tax=Uruburuella testudinis TaxID=1282863 RepID=A0ABY4DVP9_9NEIS|nr:hypothetical protein [Uruburuella testudinis]UOO83118.1 hypothetical protein LVJ83_06570 [Uruburuella testudinis]
MALTLGLVFLGSFYFLFFIGKFFSLGDRFKEKYDVEIEFLFYLIAGVITVIVYLNI